MAVLPSRVDLPPQPLQRAGGLWAAAQPGDQNSRWESGVVAWFDDVPGWRVAQDCVPDTVSYGPDQDAQRPTAARPYVIQSAARCPRSNIAGMAERARMRLDAVTPRAVAHELWTGDMTRADPYDLPVGYDWTNPADGAQWLTPSLSAAAETLSGTFTELVSAVGAVESAVADRLIAGVPHIHMPLHLVMELALYLEPQGDLLRTPTGGIIVGDYGYPGTGPAASGATPAAGTWIYGSGPVTIWTGPGAVLDEPSQIVDVRDNTIEVWAERPALALFDPATAVAAQLT